MNCTIINIGDELLIGQVINTNAAYLGDVLGRYGISVSRTITIPDDHEAIFTTLDHYRSSADLIIITGGLGPTRDDITKKTLATYFDSTMSYHEESFQNIERLFAQYNRIADNRYKDQCYMPDKATILINKTGTSSGMWFEKDNVIFVSIPGVPKEMKYLMKYEIIPRISQRFKTPNIVHHTIHICGKGETDLIDLLAETESSLPVNFKLAYLPNSSKGMLRMRLTGLGEDSNILESQVNIISAKIKDKLGDIVVGENDDTLEVVVGKLLRKKNLTISTAESCTGGSIAQKITSIPGSSSYFIGSVIAYDNDIKKQLLAVSDSTLYNHGSVSEQCVLEMSSGVKEALNTDVSIAVSGVAGPTGGSAEKPVGTIWMAIRIGDRVKTKKLKLSKNRSENIEKTSNYALDLLRKMLLEK